MNEPKSKCTTCGRPILATRNGIICAPCHDKEIDADTAAFMASFLPDYRHQPEIDRDAAERLYVFIEERRKPRYQEWFPRLRAFADKCRKLQPVPADESLSVCEQAKLQILQGKLNRCTREIERSRDVAICTMPLFAFSFAQRQWSGNDGRIVLLTPEEQRQWDEIYTHPPTSFQWYRQYYWVIDESPQRELAKGYAMWAEWEFQDREAAWLVKTGEGVGPLDGKFTVELWSWNGAKAKFIRCIFSGVS
jgi:hypothetical protein